jgi:hypothetical protein
LASATRKVAAMNAEISTPKIPTVIDVELSQLAHKLPSVFPGGTRPDAMPPRAAPSMNGVMTDEIPNAAVRTRFRPALCATLRNANPAPRTTMPTPARMIGMYSVRMIEPNAEGNAVQHTMAAKMSQTLLASHTGAIAWSMSPRGRSPRRVPPAERSQNPAP